MRILNLGGGQQSIAIYLMAANGHEGIEPLDYAIFADTGEEPSWVLEQVAALAEYRTPEGKPGAPILARWRKDSEGNQVRLGDNLLHGNNDRHASIPAFILHRDLFDRNGPVQGKQTRQCTAEFKISVVERAIRRELLGLKPGEAYKGERITQVFGFDFSEAKRIVRTKDRLANGILSVGDFPLWDLQWKRKDCVEYVAEVWGREVLPSACTFCPLVNARFRRLLKDRDPNGLVRACQVDAGLREPGAHAAKGMSGDLYVHRSMLPLESIDLDNDQDEGLFAGMNGTCLTGYCGH